MEKIIINTEDSLSGIMVGGRWQAVTKMLPESNVVIVTDDNVYNIYGSQFPRFPVIRIKAGEKSKHLAVIGKLVDELLGLGVDRSWFILGIGGGVVCDITGFLASVYMRGIRFGFVSTSLLSQIDASVGGKNGVDAGGYKNVIGTFNQPEFVICDPDMLKTLSPAEYLSGMAEMLKTGFIGDRELIDIADNKHMEIMERDRQTLTMAVSRAIKFKGSVVAGDEKETGNRRILNFGHTFGHAIEMANNLLHGFGVASGMELALHLSHEKGLLSKTDLTFAKMLLQRYDLLLSSDVSPEKMEELIMHDKKKTGDSIHFVLLTSIGSSVVETVSIEELMDFYSNFDKNRKK